MMKNDEKMMKHEDLRRTFEGISSAEVLRVAGLRHRRPAPKAAAACEGRGTVGAGGQAAKAVPAGDIEIYIAIDVKDLFITFLFLW